MLLLKKKKGWGKKILGDSIFGRSAAGFCGCPNLPQIYLGVTRATYAPLDPYLINYLLIYYYLGQLSLHADPQQESATDLITHRSYK